MSGPPTTPLERLTAVASDVLAAFEPTGEVVLVAESVRRVLGFDPATWAVMSDDDRVHTLDRPLWVSLLLDAVANPGREVRGAVRARHADGRFVWCDAVVIGDDSGRAMVSLRDASELRRVRAELDRRTLHDRLTGLPNRAALLRALARTLESGVPVAVLVCDLDGLEVVNVGYGHAGGDELIALAGARLETEAPAPALVARVSGDKFAVVLAGADPGTAAQIADQLLHAFRRPFALSGDTVTTTLSIGIAHGSLSDDAARLVNDADAAMDEAKMAGKDRHATFSGALRDRALARQEVTKMLPSAAERGELRLHFQPVVDLRDNAVVAAEGLIRWQHPVRGLLPPQEFIPIAEESGSVVGLGEWVAREAVRLVRHVRELDRSGRFQTLWVNLSPRQLHRPGLVATMAEVLAGSGVGAGELGFEITESALLDDVSVAVSELTALRDLGFGLALDDFGTGWSSLAQLRALPLDVLKVDRSFTAGLGRERDEAIVAAVISLGHALGLQVCAEGVETPGQLRRLRDMGCDTAMGFHVARPMPFEEFEALLSRTR